MITYEEALSYVKIHRDEIIKAVNEGDTLSQNIVTAHQMLVRCWDPGAEAIFTGFVNDWIQRQETREWDEVKKQKVAWGE